MTITIYGAGAIGGITTARLAQAGHDVLSSECGGGR
jgi:ketopantoate reductase